LKERVLTLAKEFNDPDLSEFKADFGRSAAGASGRGLLLRFSWLVFAGQGDRGRAYTLEDGLVVQIALPGLFRAIRDGARL